MSRFGGLLATAWVCAFAANARAEDAGERAPAASIRIGIAPSITPEQVLAEFQPIGDHLARQLGVPVQFVIAKGYDHNLELLQTRQVELAILSPLPVARALNEVQGAQLLACEIRQGKRSYRGYILARLGTKVRTLADLKGKRMAFVARSSTSGYLFPVHLLVQDGLISGHGELESFFSEVRFLKRHDEVLRALIRGDVDVGAVSDDALEQGMRLGLDPAGVRIVARTAAIPHEAVVAAPGLDANLVVRIREALLAIDTRTATGRALLKPMNSTLKLNGFAACDAAAFSPLLGVLEADR